MDPRKYNLITELCLWTAVISVLIIDRVDYPYKTLANIVFILAGAIALVTYFYNFHSLGESGKNEHSEISKDSLEGDIKNFIRQNGMTEAEYLKWTSYVFIEYVREVTDDNKNGDKDEFI